MGQEIQKEVDSWEKDLPVLLTFINIQKRFDLIFTQQI